MLELAWITKEWLLQLSSIESKPLRRREHRISIESWYCIPEKKSAITEEASKGESLSLLKRSTERIAMITFDFATKPFQYRNIQGSDRQ